MVCIRRWNVDRREAMIYQRPDESGQLARGSDSGQRLFGGTTTAAAAAAATATAAAAAAASASASASATATASTASRATAAAAAPAAPSPAIAITAAHGGDDHRRDGITVLHRPRVGLPRGGGASVGGSASTALSCAADAPASPVKKESRQRKRPLAAATSCSAVQTPPMLSETR